MNFDINYDLSDSEDEMHAEYLLAYPPIPDEVLERELAASQQYFGEGDGGEGDADDAHAQVTDEADDTHAQVTDEADDMHAQETGDDAEKMHSEVSKYLEKAVTTQCKRNMRYTTDRFVEFAKENGVNCLQRIPHARLCDLLCAHLMVVKKIDGKDYQVGSFHNYVISLAAGLVKHYDKPDVTKDAVFNRVKRTVSQRKADLKALGNGNLPNRAEAVRDHEEEQMWLRRALGDIDPEVLQQTKWFFVTVGLGFRGRQESRQLKWGDLEIRKDDLTGELRLVWCCERLAKMRRGQRGAAELRKYDTFLVENTQMPERCPIRLYKKFAEKRPADFNTPDAPFFLCVNHPIAILKSEGWKKPGAPWYKRIPMGVNMIGKFMKVIAKMADVEGRKTNHSLRRTSIQRLRGANVPPNLTIQLTGHKRTDSLNYYSEAAPEQQRAMAAIAQRLPDPQLPSIMPAESALPLPRTPQQALIPPPAFRTASTPPATGKIG